MITYILCEIAIVCAANMAKMNTDLLGLEENDELDVESVREGIERFLYFAAEKAKQHRREIQDEKSKSRHSKEVEEFFSKPENAEDLTRTLTTKDGREWKRGGNVFTKETDFEAEARKLVYQTGIQNEDGSSARSIKADDMNFADGDPKKLDNSFASEYIQPPVTKIAFIKKEYFDRLFPSVVEQKPGRDYYPRIFGIQMLILIYSLLFWELLNGNATTIADALNSDSLNSEMVTFFCIQLLFMSVDRYLSN